MPHQVTIWFRVDGPTVYLVTMDMKRHWTRSVQQARPEVQLWIGKEKFAGEVVQLVSAEIARVIELMKKKYWMSRIYLWFGGRPMVFSG